MFNQKENMYVISTLQQLKMYCYLKNIHFGSFMTWAFGEYWENTKLTDFPSLWNHRHEVLTQIKDPRNMLDALLPMIDWYLQVNKPQE